MKNMYLLFFAMLVATATIAQNTQRSNTTANPHSTSRTAAMVSSITSGVWENPAIWSTGFVPGAGDDVIISPNHTVTVGTGVDVSFSVTIQAGGTLSISGGVLTVGVTFNNHQMTNNGTLNMTGGTLVVNGSLTTNAGSTFNMSAGTINIDPNDGTAPGSFTGNDIFRINISGSAFNVTGGNINLQDPPYNIGQRILVYNSPSNDAAIASTCIVTIGGGNDQNAANTDGFLIECRGTTGILELGRLLVNGGRYSARRHMTTGFVTKVKNLTTSAGSEIIYKSGFFAIKGNVVNDGIITTTAGASYFFMLGEFIYDATLGKLIVFPSPIAQSIIGNGFFKNDIADADPTSQTGNLIRKFLVYHTTTSPGLTLGLPLTVYTELMLRTGKVNTLSTSVLGLGTPASLPGYPTPLTPTSGALTDSVSTPTSSQNYNGGWVVGPFRRYFTPTITTPNEGLLPVGSDTTRVAQISFTTAPSTGGYLTADWSDLNGGTNGLPLNEPAVTPSTINRVVDGIWQITSTTTLAGGIYTGRFTNSRATGIVNVSGTTLLKRNNSASPWFLQGNHVPSTGTNTNPTVSRTNLSGFSEFAIGGNFPATLPVNIEFFKGSKIAENNFLEWKINCTNTSSVTMSLERSGDGNTFASIQDRSATAARCGQGFTYTDASPLTGRNYYRLKTTTASGDFKYSSVVVLINKEKGFDIISMAPNPVQTNSTLSISTTKSGKMNVVVADAAGRMVMTQSINTIAGNNPINFNFSSLASGTYTLRVQNSDNEIKTTRFVKY